MNRLLSCFAPVGLFLTIVCLPSLALAQNSPEPKPSSGPNQTIRPAVPPSTFKRANTWDLNLEGGYIYRLRPENEKKGAGLGRAKVGALFIRDPAVFSIGGTAEFSGLAPFTFGVQAEAIHLESGMWAQIGGLIDVKGKPGGMFSLGWSVFGVEAQYRNYHDVGAGLALMAKLRVPVGLIVYGLTN